MLKFLQAPEKPGAFSFSFCTMASVKKRQKAETQYRLHEVTNSAPSGLGEVSATAAGKSNRASREHGVWNPRVYVGCKPEAGHEGATLRKHARRARAQAHTNWVQQGQYRWVEHLRRLFCNSYCFLILQASRYVPPIGKYALGGHAEDAQTVH